MSRSSNARIVEWGTPPEPEPTGWDAVAAELEAKAGEWASLGEYVTASARKVTRERFPASAGFESRYAPATTDGKVVLWVRKLPTPAPRGKVSKETAPDKP